MRASAPAASHQGDESSDGTTKKMTVTVIELVLKIAVLIMTLEKLLWMTMKRLQGSW